MGSTYPELRGVAIDSGRPDDGGANPDCYAKNFPGGITVIWDVDQGGANTEIRSRKLAITNGNLGVVDNDGYADFDTTGLYNGDLTYVAVSYICIVDFPGPNNLPFFARAYSHNLYNIIVYQAGDPLWAGDVVYYTNP